MKKCYITRIEKSNAFYLISQYRFEKRVRKEWFNPPSDISNIKLKLNIGGQKFELAANEIMKDRFSLFTVLLSQNCIIHPESDNYYFFDRDWFLFRYIKLFMEHKTLPEKRSTLDALYHEAEFFHLEEMKNAIRAKLEMNGQLPTGVPISTLQQNSNYNYYNNLQYEQQQMYNFHRDKKDLYETRTKKDPLPDPFGFTKGYK